MSNNIKGITIEIGGNTTKLTKALDDVNGRSKDIQAELRNVEKLLKLDPTNVELLAQKQDILSKATTNSKDKLETLKEAENQLNESYKQGIVSTEEYEKQQAGLRREIINAEQQLKFQEEQLKQQVIALNSAAYATKDFGNKATELAKTLTPLSIAGAAVVAGMASVAVSAGQSADDINTLSKITGISTEELQKFAYASDIIDVSQETMSGSLVKLTRNMESARQGGKAQKEVFEALGVSYVEVSGELRSNQDVFYEIIDALSEIDNETQRDALAMQLLGKSAQDLNPLIEGGSVQLKELGEKAKEAGLILGKDALDGANAFNDVLDETKADLEATKDVIGTTIAEAFLPLVETIADVITRITSHLREMDSGTLTTIGVIAMLVMVIAPVIATIGQLAFGINQIILILPMIQTGLSVLGGAFSLILSPIGLVVTAITLLATTLIYLWNTNEEFKNNLIRLWESISEFFSVTLTNIQVFFGSVFDTINQIIKSFGLLAKGDFEGFLNGMKELVINFIPKMAQAGRDLFNGMWNGMKEIWENLKTWVSDTVSWLMDKLAFWRSSKSEMGGSDEDGSHAKGLAYVPFDGYRAILHEGERILTRAENKDYDPKPKTSGGNPPVINQNFYNLPQSPAEQQRIAAREFKRMAVVE